MVGFLRVAREGSLAIAVSVAILTVPVAPKRAEAWPSLSDIGRAVVSVVDVTRPIGKIVLGAIITPVIPPLGIGLVGWGIWQHFHDGADQLKKPVNGNIPSNPSIEGSGRGPSRGGERIPGSAPGTPGSGGPGTEIPGGNPNPPGGTGNPANVPGIDPRIHTGPGGTNVDRRPGVTGGVNVTRDETTRPTGLGNSGNGRTGNDGPGVGTPR